MYQADHYPANIYLDHRNTRTGCSAPGTLKYIRNMLDTANVVTKAAT